MKTFEKQVLDQLNEMRDAYNHLADAYSKLTVAYEQILQNQKDMAVYLQQMTSEEEDLPPGSDLETKFDELDLPEHPEQL